MPTDRHGSPPVTVYLNLASKSAGTDALSLRTLRSASGNDWTRAPFSCFHFPGPVSHRSGFGLAKSSFAMSLPDDLDIAVAGSRLALASAILALATASRAAATFASAALR